LKSEADYIKVLPMVSTGYDPQVAPRGF